MDAKRAIARRVVELYHGADEARAAEDRWTARFSRRELPEDLPEFPIAAGEVTVNIPEVLLAAGLVASKSEARRLLADGGIRLDGDKLPADPGPLACGELVGKVLQRGRLRAVRLVAKK